MGMNNEVGILAGGMRTAAGGYRVMSFFLSPKHHHLLYQWDNLMPLAGILSLFCVSDKLNKDILINICRAQNHHRLHLN